MGVRDIGSTRMRTSLAAAATSRAARSAVVAAARGVNAATRGLQLSAGEFKSVDTNVAMAANVTTSVQLLNGIARGDDINQRNGREVTMKSIQLKGFMMATAGTGADQLIRTLIVYDRQTNAAALTALQVLTLADPIAPRNLENRRRFKILWDKTATINAASEPGTMRYFEWYRRLAHPITFNTDGGATVAAITTGSLYAITIGTNAVGATAGYSQFNCRIRYVDN